MDMSLYKLSYFQYARFKILAVNLTLGTVLVRWYSTVVGKMGTGVFENLHINTTQSFGLTSVSSMHRMVLKMRYDQSNTTFKE